MKFTSCLFKYGFIMSGLLYTSIFFLGLFFIQNATAQEVRKYKPSRHYAPNYYLNDAASVELFVDDFYPSDARLQIKIANKNAFGFEGPPKDQEEKKYMNSVIKTLKTQITEVVKIVKDIDCQYQLLEINDYKNDDKIVARYNIKCKEDLRWGRVMVDFSSRFLQVKRLYIKVEAMETWGYLVEGNYALASLI